MAAWTQHRTALRCRQPRSVLIGLKNRSDGRNFIPGFRPQHTASAGGWQALTAPSFPP
jgi:hypothetical protein